MISSTKLKPGSRARAVASVNLAPRTLRIG
jgi:hypothetical protein